MMYSCPYCGRIHPYTYICEKRRKYGRQNDSRENRFRHSRLWTKKSVEIRTRDKYLCAYCLEHDHTINAHMVEVHHIVPVEEDYSLRLDNDNLISLCREHHEEAEKGRIDRDILKGIAQMHEASVEP